MTEKAEELTPEQIQEEEDKFFAEATAPGSMQRIQQGGEFLDPAPPDTMYSDQETTDNIIEQSRSHFSKCAAIAALEHNPGFTAIMNRIEEMRSLFHADNEGMVNEKGLLDAARMQANIYASAKLKDLKDWIENQVGDYKTHIRESQDDK